MYHQENIREIISRSLCTRGLVLLGIVDLDVRSDYKRFTNWLEQGLHGEMGFLERHLQCRENPQNILAGAKSAIIFGLNYYRGDKRLPTPSEDVTRASGVSAPPKVAQYARSRDYHKVMRQSGEAAWREIASSYLEVSEDQGRVVVDSAPVLERSLAAKTENGFIGKNTCFIHPSEGSFFLLAEILTTVDLPQDSKVPVNPEKRMTAGGCGSCQRCQVACPTGALSKDYVLDARKCLSYWTIEHRGTIPEEYWPHFDLYYFGCDICQLVCPYNRHAQVAHSLKEVDLPSLFATATMSQSQYVTWFGGTPMTRAKRDGLRRNALIAMTVRRDPDLPRALELLANTSSNVLRETMSQIERWSATNK